MIPHPLQLFLLLHGHSSQENYLHCLTPFPHPLLTPRPTPIWLPRVSPHSNGSPLHDFHTSGHSSLFCPHGAPPLGPFDSLGHSLLLKAPRALGSAKPHPPPCLRGQLLFLVSSLQAASWSTSRLGSLLSPSLRVLSSFYTTGLLGTRSSSQKNIFESIKEDTQPYLYFKGNHSYGNSHQNIFRNL